MFDPDIPDINDRFVGTLRYDVYIQRVGEEILGEQPQYTIRYAFTKPYGEDGVIEELPLGTQVLTWGLPTTAIFEKSLTAIHNGRVWGMANQGEALWRDQGDEMSYEIANQANRFVLSYSEVGWANLMSDRSFIPIQPTQSSRFTGLVSTPSGLLVMFENEMFLITGDPAFGNVSVELYLDMVGMDPPTENDGVPRPAKVGGLPFVIWNGKIWMIQAGNSQQLAPDQWLRSDPFVRISPEPQTRSLLALTSSGQVFRYILDDQFWLTDPVTRSGDNIVELLPNCTCITGDNTRMVSRSTRWNPDEEEFELYYPVWSTRLDGTPDTPHLYYRSIDFGEPQKRHALYLVKFGVENYLRNTVRTSDTFDPTVLPVAFFQSDRADNTLSAGLPDISIEEPIPTGGRLPYSLARVRAAGGAYSWRFPLAETRASGIDVRLELRGMGYDDVFRLPIEFAYASGGATR
jgi:hypothetical protein